MRKDLRRAPAHGVISLTAADWSAIAALGQWAAAAATVWAVVVALGSNRPRVRVQADFGVFRTRPDDTAMFDMTLPTDSEGKRALGIHITNTGHVPVSIQWAGFENPLGYLDVVLNYPDGAVGPIRLMPHSVALVSLTNDVWRGLALRSTSQAVVWDATGRKYRCGCTLRTRLWRTFYFRWGRGSEKLSEKTNYGPFLLVPCQGIWVDGNRIPS